MCAIHRKAVAFTILNAGLMFWQVLEQEFTQDALEPSPGQTVKTVCTALVHASPGLYAWHCINRMVRMHASPPTHQRARC